VSHVSSLMLAASFSFGAIVAQAEGDPDKGERVFRKCKACHAIGEGAKTRTGPILTGIVGASAMHDPAFDYSDALKAAATDGLIWDEESLAAFLAKPRDFLTDTKMSFSGLRKDEEIEDIISYLAQQ
jgi:cytochrome c